MGQYVEYWINNPGLDQILLKVTFSRWKFLPPATKLRQVNVFTPVCQSFCSQGVSASGLGGVCQTTTWADTPMGRPPPSRHPLPSGCWNTHLPSQCMLGYTPPADCMLGCTPPCPVHAGIYTPCPVHAGMHTPPTQCMLGYGQ